jgi:transcriptional regulator with XRE-family HTH domain
MAKKIPNPIDTHVGSRVRMRRLILSMSQEKLADAIGLTFQQVQKYEKGTNRMGSSRLVQIANVLKVPVTFFFEGAPGQSKLDGKAQSPAFVSNFLATSDGLALTKAFMRIKDAKLRRSIVKTVEVIAGDA